MQNVIVRAAFVVMPLGLAAWVGCGSAPTEGDTALVDLAGRDAQASPGVQESDAGDAAHGGWARNCEGAAETDSDGLKKHLECAGLYSDFNAKVIRADNRSYMPGVTFWSDGADKSRFVYLPPGAKINIANFDEWTFPDGTKFWKEFRLNAKRIETRLYEKSKGAWRYTTYRWNDAETDAVRKDNGDKVARVAGPAYEVPARAACDTCHAGRAEPVLGFEAVSLGLPTAQGVTLAMLAAEGRLSGAPPTTAFEVPNDHNGTAAQALGWLHANCGACHNSNPAAAAQFTQLFFLLRPSQLKAKSARVQDLDAYITAVSVPSSKTNAATGKPYFRIAPKDPASSLTSLLSGRRVAPAEEPNADYQMPPLVTRTPDVNGHALLDAWINALP